MRSIARTFAVLALLAGVLLQACGGGNGAGSTGPHALNVNGAWPVFTEVITDVANSTTCNDTAVVTLTQSGASFTGGTTQSGTCHTPGGPVDNSGVAQITGGNVSGNFISWTTPGDPSCAYTGQLTGTPPATATGTVSCAGSVKNYSGNWQMHR